MSCKIVGWTRREFVSRAAAAVAAPYVITSAALGADDRPAASERIVMAGIGIGNMGSGDLGAFSGRKEVQYVAVCDVRKGAAETAKKRIDDRYKNSDCRIYGDFRDVLARGDIDAVHVATPDHWHAVIVVNACRAGKDVYCQKPESLTIREGRFMVQAARRYGRVVSGGSQRVMDDYGNRVARPCWNGELGTLKEVFVNVGGPSKLCYLGGQPIPDGVDWDMWLGPAPWAPYHEHRLSGTYSINGTGWRSWKDYSGGGMTDWGAHKFGGAMFACGIRDQGPTEVIPPDGKDVKFLTFVFANGFKMYHANKGDVDVVGTPGEKIAPKEMPTYKGTGGIYGDFLHCVKSREKPFRDIEFAHRTVSICHLGNIAYELKRPLKWDPAKEIFPGDEEANRMLDRAKREPWVLS